MSESKKAYINPLGFREYDARWLYKKEINLEGIKLVGKGFGTQVIKKNKRKNKVTVGHDYRSYSEEVKKKFIEGLMESGCNVEDIGLCLSPTVYYAQFKLKSDAVAMITASHNENGWTGIKMGIEKGLTHSKKEMQNLRNIVINKKFSKGKGSYKKIKNFNKKYINFLSKNILKKKLKIVVSCGNGTAGIFAPKVLKKIGCKVIKLNCNLDYTFPNHNPNPEDVKMLRSLSKAVKKNKADLGFAFDGDGDRLGVVDDNGKEVFSDKVGLLIARSLSSKNKAKFIVDVKSTGLFSNDKILKKNQSKVIYWKTGHSYIKRKVKHEKALAGFEKSGHFFFNKPIGLGYDDGILSAIQTCKILNDNKEKKISKIIGDLPKTFQSPTMAPFCDDKDKYLVIHNLSKSVSKLFKNNKKIAGRKIIKVNKINGIRFTLEDNSWGLIRASSNKPSLVVVVESNISNLDMKNIFKFIDILLTKTGKVGKYDQKI